MNNVGLMPLGLANEHLIASARSAIEDVLPMRAYLKEPLLEIQEFYDIERGQYNAREILLRMKKLLPSNEGLVVAVCGVDLFSPILTYVFGEAEFLGNVAVVSYHRLAPEVYGLQPNLPLLRERTSKEVIHEIGHTFGLRHCSDIGCVMHASTYAEEIDLKTKAFCRACSSLVKIHVN